ncbi:LacI family DNA-binding transcriptional regulator [Oricola thermophila]|uniref:LacI family DNA-binding transcriptional regulator n=2 Tax=Oricola thermophila TaxID=2742145 RepID=A0A6N1VJN8_9HYPH|nr:LacI family DNA-binding transcriptional regulator [Oricola thermophila]
MRAPKIKDVARLAGVSTATVSRALNRPDTVAESTRKAVVEAAVRTGYRINLAARNLRRQRTGAVVVLVPNLGNPFFSEILSGIEVTLAAAGLSVLVADTKHSAVPAGLVFDYLHRGRADGIISLDGALPEIISAFPQAEGALPPIIYACEWNDTVPMPSIRADNIAGASMAVSHLVELGHTRIGHIRGPADNILTQVRSAETRDAIIGHGLAVRPDWFFDGDFSLASGRRVAEQWLALDDRPTGVFCSSDEMALGFISGLHESGVKVPEDVSVVGFDDIEIARHFIPTLTTIRQPRTELGVAAGRLLIRLVEGSSTVLSDYREMIPVELVVRGSTGAPR